MNDAWGEDLDGIAQNGGGALRKFAEDTAKTNRELLDRIAKLEAQNTRNTVADLIESQGVSRQAAKYYGGDADPEKVTAWVTDMRTAFGGAVPQDTQPVEPVLNPTDMAQYQSMMQAGANGNPVNSNMDTLGASIHDAKTPAEMIAAFQRFGR